MSDNLGRYKANLEVLVRSLQRQESSAKHAALYHAIEYGKASTSHEPWRSSFEKIEKVEKDCDLSIAPLIRVLYEDAFEEVEAGEGSDDVDSPFALQRRDSRIERSQRRALELKQFKQRICIALDQFPFWPERTSKGEANGKRMKDLVFWTEHHILLLLSSAYLFCQYMAHLPDSQGDGNASGYKHRLFRYRVLLRRYLDAYSRARDGERSPSTACFEVNSHVYLSFSIAALINLVDLARDRDIRESARKVLDGMVFLVMLCTDPLTGTANLCASARNPVRTTQRTHGHTMGQLVRLMACTDRDPYEPNYLSAFLATTRWMPEDRAFTDALHGCGSVAKRLPCNRSEAELCRVFGTSDFDDDVMPMYWSAGGMVFSTLREKSKSFVDRFALNDHKHLAVLWQLDFATFFASSALHEHFLRGQSCLGVSLSTYKLPGLVLSSFELFHPHYCGFEQLPWCANVAGVPVYSRSGTGAVFKGVNVANTHNPAVLQRGSMLVAAYVRPPPLDGLAVNLVLSPKVYLLWPTKLFTRNWTLRHGTFSLTLNGLDALSQHRTHEDRLWFIGEREGSYIACLFTKPWLWGKAPSDQDKFKERESSTGRERETAFDCVYSEFKQVSLVCVVGSALVYGSVEDFVTCRLSNIDVDDGLRDNRDGGRDKEYFVRVNDKLFEEGLVEYSCHAKDPYESLMRDSPINKFVKNRQIKTYRDSRFPYNDEASLLLSNDLIEIPGACLHFTHVDGEGDSAAGLLGAGSFGKVECATLRLQSGSEGPAVPVAVKVPHLCAEVCADEQIANELSLIKHFKGLPYLVQCYGCALLEGRPALVLERAQYGSLMDILIARTRESESVRALPPGLCCRWLRDVAGALMYLHEQGVVHRDLKPGNILVFKGLRVKVTDFGTSKFQRDLIDDDCSGTLVYMAPEVRAFLRAVPTSDIFSLGMTALHLFSNSIPPIAFRSAIETFSLPFDPDSGWTRVFHDDVANKVRAIINECATFEDDKPEDYGRPCAREIHGAFKSLLLNGLDMMEEELKIIEVGVIQQLNLCS